MENIASAILAKVPKYGRTIACRLQKEQGGYRELSWPDYRSQVLRLSSFLKQKGIGRGDRVLLVSENCPEWTIAALAVFSRGAILIPVASMATKEEVENILTEIKPKFCFFSKRNQVVPAIAKEKLPEIVSWDSQTATPFDFLSQYPEEQEKNFVAEDSLTAIYIFTSGTTGNPKIVPLSHRNILTNAKDIITLVPSSAKDRLVSVLPLSHMFEFTGGFVVPALIGARVTYIKSLRAEDIIQAMRDSAATILIAVPLLFEVMARTVDTKLKAAPFPLKQYFYIAGQFVKQYPKLGKYLFLPVHKKFGGKVRFFIAGGAKLQPQVFESFAKLGIPIIQGYGLSEASPVLTASSLQNVSANNVGKALQHVEIGILNTQGKAVIAGQEGEVCARGPSIFAGYLNPEHNHDVFIGDWFRTGDLGFIDDQGALQITGRKKEIIVTANGKNVYPEEVEAKIYSVGGFLEVCVLGMVDDKEHEIVTAVVRPDPKKYFGVSGAMLDSLVRATVLQACSGLSEYKQPHRIEIILEEFPKTLTKKVKRHELRKLLLQKTEKEKPDTLSLAKTDVLNLEDELEKAVAERISIITQIPVEGIARSHLLTQDLSLDSLTIMEVLGAVETEFKIRIEGIEFATLQSVDDLLNAFREKMKKAGKLKKRRRKLFVEFAPKNNMRFYWLFPRCLINFFTFLYLKIWFKLSAFGRENLDEDSTFILTPNHSSHLDAPTVLAAMPLKIRLRTFTVAAKDYFFNSSWKSFFARLTFNAIPFDRKARIDEGMRLCKHALSSGRSLIIFPEGTRSPSGEIQSFKAGVGHLVSGQKYVKAVPVYIDGAYGILPKGRAFPRHGKLRVFFGKPISFAGYDASPQSYRRIAEKLEEEVRKLKQQAYQSTI